MSTFSRDPEPRGYLGLAATAIFSLLLAYAYLYGNVEASEGEMDRPSFDEAHIHNNPGGVVDEFLQIRDAFLLDGTKVHISGYCASACTLFLAVPDVCVYEDTRLGFHAPYMTFGNLPIRIYNDSITTYFLQHYPEPIRDWIEANGGLQPDLIWLEGEEMLKFFPLCSGVPVS